MRRLGWWCRAWCDLWEVDVVGLTDGGMWGVWTGCIKEGHRTRRITWRRDIKRDWVVSRDLRVGVGGTRQWA